jgi:hypothetical protein
VTFQQHFSVWFSEIAGEDPIRLLYTKSSENNAVLRLEEIKRLAYLTDIDNATQWHGCGLRPTADDDGVLDIHTGIHYYYTGEFIGNEEASSFSYSAFRAGALRKAISGVQSGKNIGRNIPTFHVLNRRDLKNALGQIIRHVPGNRSLLYRGQRCEYRYPHSPRILEELGYERDFFMPSLLPSIARDLSDKRSLLRESEKWKKPFLIWLIASTKLCVDPYTIASAMDILRNPNRQQFGKFLRQLYDGERGHALEEMMQNLLFGGGHEDTLPLVLQHYGFPSSYLDLTDDMEAAIYFATAGEETPAGPGVIYIFANDHNGSDQYLSSHFLFSFLANKEINIPARIKNQKAYILRGANARAKNAYGNEVLGKIVIDPNSINAEVDQEDLFPPISVDRLYKILREAQPPLRGLY